MKLAPVFAQLLAGWRSAGFELVSLRDYFAALEPRLLPRHAVTAGTVPGRCGSLAMQGAEFLKNPVLPLPA